MMPLRSQIFLSIVLYIIMVTLATRTASLAQAFRTHTIASRHTSRRNMVSTRSRRSICGHSKLGLYRATNAMIPNNRKDQHQWYYTKVCSGSLPSLLPLSGIDRACSIREQAASSDVRLFSSDKYYEDYSKPVFQPGLKVLVEVISFGPIGASVNVVAEGHSADALPPEDEEWPVLAEGLINQKELAYYRDARDNVEVVLGEILPAYVERIRDVDDKLGIGLRAFGGRAKAADLGGQIMEALKASTDGTLGLGDKSSPAAIAAHFPGTSKATFKKALSALFKQGLIERPGATETQLIK